MSSCDIFWKANWKADFPSLFWWEASAPWLRSTWQLLTFNFEKDDTTLRTSCEWYCIASCNGVLCLAFWTLIVAPPAISSYKLVSMFILCRIHLCNIKRVVHGCIMKWSRFANVFAFDVTIVPNKHLHASRNNSVKHVYHDHILIRLQEVP